VIEARRLTVPILAEPIGTTAALQEASLRARVRGFLKEIHFQEGADVKAGQLLFVIDEAPFKASLDAAQARLAEAQASQERATQSKAREVAEAQLNVDLAGLELARVEERRERSLLARNASTREDVDRRVANRKKAEAQVEADKASLEQAKADYQTNILAARASVAEAKAQVHNAELELSYCRMSSPIDGRIGMSEVKLGNLVGPATGSSSSGDYTELAVVRQLNPMGVDIQASSRYLDRLTRLISQGLPIEIFRPGLEGEQARRFAGKATVIDNTINPTTSTVLVRSEIANPEKTLLPGEYVKVNATVGEVQNAIVVPEQVVVEAQAGPTVFTVDKQNKVTVTPVRASFTHEGLRVIESGLEAGQMVIVEGLQLVRSGMTVKTRPAPPDIVGAPAGAPAKSDGAGAPEAEKSVRPESPGEGPDSDRTSKTDGSPGNTSLKTPAKP
jgi:RND family efflux transporter MFP subunit